MSKIEQLEAVEGVVGQYKLSGGFKVQHTDRLKINDSSSAVLEEILRINPQVNRISYVMFDPNISSSQGFAPGQTKLYWLARSFAVGDKLRLTSDIVFENEKDFIEETHTEALIFRRGIAIASVVKAGRETLHIPMMDFFSEPEFDEQAIVEAINPYKGVVVRTDKSYHFWGFNLLDDDGHKRFLDSCDEAGSEFRDRCGVPLVDGDYITAGRTNGYSALRLYGYKGTSRKDEPHVVAIVS